jgi:hypothetical protein
MNQSPSIRPIWKVAITGMVVAAVHVATVPFAYAMLLVPFMEHDRHGVGIEPSWVGHLAHYADAIVLSAISGSVLGNSKGVRASHGLAAGILSGLLRAGVHYGTELLRGYPPDHLCELLLGVGLCLLAFVPVMLFFCARAARMRDLTV